MRIVFAGTPPFAAQALESLIEAGHDILFVLSQPDRPSGRGMKLKASAVKECALRHGIPVLTPLSLSVKKNPDEAEEVLQKLEQSQADVLIVAAYGLILPQRALDAARGIGLNNCIKSMNIHASLLPRWRGAAPIQRAIESGDPQTGISLMKMELGLDTGPVIKMHPLPIESSDTAQTLTEKLSLLGAQAVVSALDEAQSLTVTPQDETHATYANKILKSESPINWALPADAIVQKIHAFNPFPGATAEYKGQIFKIWQASVVKASGKPGEILSSKHSLIIACGTDAISCSELQKSGKPVMEVQRFLQSFPLTVSEVLS